MSRINLLLLQVLVAVVGVALWYVLTTYPIFGKLLLPPFFFSNPVDVASQIVAWFASGVIWKHLWVTLIESVLAFVLGSIGGVLVGFWFARQPRTAAVFDPYVKMVNALPRVVLAPIFALWLGLGIWSKVALGFTLVFFIVFFNVLSRRQGSQSHGIGERAHAWNERAPVDAPRLLAIGAVLDVLLAAHISWLRGGGSRRGGISGRCCRPRLPYPAGGGRIRRRRCICGHVCTCGLCDRDRCHRHRGRKAPVGVAASGERQPPLVTAVSAGLSFRPNWTA